MKQREFNKHLNSCRTRDKKRVDLEKVKALPETIRTDMVYYIVRYRGPVLADLLTPQIDRSWLASMGYLYTTIGKQTGFTFVHTCEHRIN
jgi:hypothetical protein